jgi:hypothetical protein
VSVCMRGLDRSWGEGKLEPAPATPGETGNHRRRRVPGPVPGGQAASQDGGQGCQWGRGRKGHTWPAEWGHSPLSPPPLPFRTSSTPQLSGPLLRKTYYLHSKTYQSPYSHPSKGKEDFFFFLKGPEGVEWLVDDEVSACTHRGFCLPWRVKPRLSERGAGPPPPPPPRPPPPRHPPPPSTGPSELHCPPWAQPLA